MFSVRSSPDPPIFKKMQSDPVLIRPKLASILIQSDPVLIRAHLWFPPHPGLPTSKYKKTPQEGLWGKRAKAALKFVTLWPRKRNENKGFSTTNKRTAYAAHNARHNDEGKTHENTWRVGAQEIRKAHSKPQHTGGNREHTRAPKFGTKLQHTGKWLRKVHDEVWKR